MGWIERQMRQLRRVTNEEPTWRAKLGISVRRQQMRFRRMLAMSRKEETEGDGWFRNVSVREMQPITIQVREPRQRDESAELCDCPYWAITDGAAIDGN